MPSVYKYSLAPHILPTRYRKQQLHTTHILLPLHPWQHLLTTSSMQVPQQEMFLAGDVVFTSLGDVIFTFTSLHLHGSRRCGLHLPGRRGLLRLTTGNLESM